MKKVLCLITVFLIFGSSVFALQKDDKKKASGSATGTHPYRMCFVDVEKVFRSLPESGDIESASKALEAQYVDSLKKMQDEFQKRLETYDKQKTLMTTEQQKKEEDALRLQQSNFLKFKEEKVQELTQANETLLAPIREKIRKAIAEISEEEGIDAVLTKNSQVVLYNDDSLDITFKVLDKITRKGKK